MLLFQIAASKKIKVHVICKCHNVEHCWPLKRLPFCSIEDFRRKLIKDFEQLIFLLRPKNSVLNASLPSMNLQQFED